MTDLLIMTGLLALVTVLLMYKRKLKMDRLEREKDNPPKPVKPLTHDEFVRSIDMLMFQGIISPMQHNEYIQKGLPFTR